MKVEYSNRALTDLRKAAEDSREFGEAAGLALEARIVAVIRRIAEHPRAAQGVTDRPGIHVVPLIRFPYKIFYRAHEGSVTILHIRHTSRRPWIGER